MVNGKFLKPKVTPAGLRVLAGVVALTFLIIGLGLLEVFDAQDQLITVFTFGAGLFLVVDIGIRQGLRLRKAGDIFNILGLIAGLAIIVTSLFAFAGFAVLTGAMGVIVVGVGFVLAAIEIFR